MMHDVLQQASAYAKAHRRKKYWYQIVTCLACIVVFCTTYALILPAITLERNQCELTEHTHSELCYTQITSVIKTELVCTYGQLNVHQHTSDCFDENGDLVCGYADFVVHKHDSSCYDENGNLWCALPEIEAHTHDESCFVSESEDTEEGADTSESEFICGKEEILLHTHTAECFDENGNLICGKIEIAEHVHSESCFQNVDVPVDTDELTCEIPESEEHQHGPLCYGIWELTCTLPEHTHSEECQSTDIVSDPQADIETQSDWEKTLDGVTLTGDFRTDLIAVAQSQLGYAESSLNFVNTEDGELKGYSRYGAWYGDPYGDWCAMFVSFCLSYAQVDGMPFEESCSKWIELLSDEEYGCYLTAEEHIPCPGDIVFFDFDDNSAADHVGIVTEYVPETIESSACINVIEGNSGNKVRSVTYELGDSHIAGYGLLPEQEFICGKTGHVHTDACINSEGNLFCGLEEHIHTDICRDGGVSYEFSELIYYGADYTVSVRYGADAGLPDGVEMTAEEIPADSEEYRLYCEQTVAALGTEEAEKLLFARFFDIRFTVNGEKIEPAAPVSVTITYAEAVEAPEPATCQAVHFAEDGPEIIEAQTETPDDGTTSFTHTQDSFSIVGSIVAVNASYNSTDVGPDAFPVDYYVYIDGAWTCVGSTKTGWCGNYNLSLSEWTNNNRDCITVEQANSILGAYGFDAYADNAALQIAYQRKETDKDANLHCDTESYFDTSRSESALVPLARNEDKTSGYNVYFLPGNTNNNYSSSLENVNKTGSEFYTVSVYDPNHLAYAEGEAIPDTLTVLTGRSTSVTVRALADNSGASWQCVNSSWSKIADGTANGDGTVTFNLSNITQTLRITPVTTDLGTSSEQTVHYLVYLDGAWTEVGTTVGIYKNEAWEDFTRRFVTSTQVESVLGPFGFKSSEYSYTEGQGNSLVHQFKTGTLESTFWSDNNSKQLPDGSWAIGLSYDEVAYKLYYLPANISFTDITPSSYAADSNLMSGNHFWSIKVRDDSHLVYSEGELEGLTQYTVDGGEITVTVHNAEGILWSCVGLNGDSLTVESTQSGGYTTFVINNITQPVRIVPTAANPGFTVQYYANIPRFATSGNNPLTVIDTSGKSLPTNGGSMATRNLYLEGTGQYTNQNKGNSTELFRVSTTTELTKMYSEQSLHYESSPGLEYFNKLKDNENYALSEIWILKSGKDPTSTNRDDWEIRTYQTDMAFTNEASQAIGNTILIGDGAVIRLVFDTNSGSYFNDTTFYDYNISSGQNADGRWRTGTTGINIESNYGKSSNGQRTWRSGADILAFGNANCGTGMSGYLFDEGTLNKYNSRNSGYGGTTFGIANSLNTSTGTIVYNEWIVAPKLFNDGDANGKQTYTGSSLTFDRVGDTYTLSAATLKNSNGQSNTLSGLQYFFNPSPTSNTTYTHIFTNNFWPMDQAAGRTDALWGEYGNPGSFQGFVESNSYNWSSLAKNFPPSDDGNAHNWFFGMNFAISFSLTADYEGPLEYYFFGDDDMWVFLDEKLVCDIGGVHSSVGEYVNLRDYLPVGSSGQHTLSFFYTERGASGSTCYMSFTLPSVSSATTSSDTGSLKITKNLSGEAETLSEREYRFKIELLSSENGSALNRTFPYIQTTANSSSELYGTVNNGTIITMKAGDTVTVSGIPAGTFYRVTELTTEGYKVTANDSEGYIVSGTMESGAIKPAAFVNTPYFELPETGGPGAEKYTIGGLLLVMAAGILLLYNHKKRGREDFSSS